MEIGTRLQIQCYKHNKKIHRAWQDAVLLEEHDDYIICINNKTLVTESNGNMWRTKEPAIIYFFKKEWFNVIAQLKKDGIYYYCNIASPYIIEDNTIKYIDYDLDLRIFPSGEYKVLDLLEYKYHKRIMKYSNELDSIIKATMDDLIQKYKKGYFPFLNSENIRLSNKSASVM